MPTTFSDRYSQASLVPYKWEDEVILDDYPVAANQVIALGNTVAVVTAATATDVQTLTNTGTGGTFTVQFGNAQVYTTTPLNCASCTAAQLQAALQALPNIGSGGCTVSGGPFTSGGGSLVVTFAGALAGQPQPLLVINNSASTGGTVTVAHTTQGVQNGSLVNYVGTKVANPSAAPVPTVAGADGTLAVGSYSVTYTYVTAAGESLPSPAATIAVASTNHIAIASITSIPTGVVSVNVYLDGVFFKNQAVTSGATGGFNILAPASGAALTQPTVSTAFLNSDGSQIPIGFAWYAMAADTTGKITQGNSVPSGNPFGNIEYTGNVAIAGAFPCASLNGGAGIDQVTADRLGRLISGSLATGYFMAVGI